MDFINKEYLFSPIRCVPILTLSPALNWGLDDNCSISLCRLKYTVLSFFFLLASMGITLMELCSVLLYCLKAAVCKYRLKVCKMKKIENPQTLSEYGSR